MSEHSVAGYTIGPYPVGQGQPLLLLAGPCLLESPGLCDEVAASLAATCRTLGINFIFKGSFDKANRTSLHSPRGPGLDAGLGMLSEIAERYGVPVTTDVHEPRQCVPVADVCRLLQIPAFLCRQTDLLQAAGQAAGQYAGGAVNIKKGQFLAPADMRHAAAKVREAGCPRVLLTERGATFGYHNLVVDYRGLVEMRQWAPVCFDATHSVQKPGGAEGKSGGDRTLVPPLARAAAAVGIDALFVETHPEPDSALSDGPNMVPLHEMEALLRSILAVRNSVNS